MPLHCWIRATRRARSELRQAVHHEDRNGGAWRLLGAIHAKQGQYADALQEYERARALDPKDPLTHSAIAEVHALRGDHVGAANWHTRVAQLALQDLDLKITAADSLYRTRRYDQALQEYEQALQMHAGHAGVRDQIGRIWSLRAEGAMTWHPFRRRYVIASALSVDQVTHCVDQAMAVGIADVRLVNQLMAYRMAAVRAVTKTWRWRKGMIPVVILFFILVLTLPSLLKILAMAAAVALVVAMGLRPRWQHTFHELPVRARPPMRRP
ncbi:tetratricopeptide repeat protein [Wenjunlia tyrosinilytica]|uniref:Tetratricopeptide repeat protein n=1 Tax=Wenjunlia tyrosinilytica TaxID=1544741 RepID=A0A918E0H4_9ACTN|nr:tetratricopeptide repeat protein [Wenjunlia tyrosinilytica]GGO98566.1 hypothetical protein GCM10012280_63000 [Wenjunlia tyrosinilytica]